MSHFANTLVAQRLINWASSSSPPLHNFLLFLFLDLISLLNLPGRNLGASQMMQPPILALNCIDFFRLSNRIMGSIVESAHVYVSTMCSHSLPPLPYEFSSKGWEMAGRLKALAALAGARDLIPTLHMRLTSICNCRSRASDSLFWLFQVLRA